MNFENYSLEHRKFSLEQWEKYILQNRNSAIVFPILPILIKVIEQFGINAAADLVIQVFFRYITNDISIQDAFARVDWYQVGISGFEGLFQWKSAGTRVIKAAATAIGDIIRNSIQDENYSINDLVLDFAIGFTGDLGGGYLAELANKYSLASLGKGMLKKFNFPYPQVCKWLGYGLKEVSETVNGITSSRRMVVWAEGKVVVIGRQMENRVKVFADGKAGSIIFDKSNPIASPYFTPEVDADWKLLTDRFGSNIPYEIAKVSKLYKANLAFIRDLKEQGYTFIDCGPGATTSLSPFYDMEINEIFN